MTDSKIEWTDKVWNPVTGCSKVSPGCENCYAERFSKRGLTGDGGGWLPWTARNAQYNVRCHPDRLEKPLHWRKPRRVFVDSMSDLFHEKVPDEFIDQVFAVMAVCGGVRHRCFRRECDHEGFDCETGGASPREQPIQTFQVLTKRPERMRSYLGADDRRERIICASETLGWTWNRFVPESAGWPLRNVWLGYSASTQKDLDAGASHLLATPAAVRFLSLEPLLGPIDLMYPETLWKDGPPMCCNGTDCGCQGRPVDPPFIWGGVDSKMIDWVIVGGESGPGARPCNVEWIRSIVNQCREAKVPVFVKQLGRHPYDAHDTLKGDGKGGMKKVGEQRAPWDLDDRKGANPDEWPEDLRVREFPP